VLRLLVDSLPSMTAVRLLQNGQCLGSIRKTLEEIGGDATGAAVEELSESSGTLEGSPGRSNKRKRGQEGAASVVVKPAFGATDIVLRLRAIADFMAILLHKPDVKGAFKTTAEDAAIILHLWLQAVQVALERASDLLQLSQAFILMWELNAKSAISSTSEIVTSFSKHCLVPVAKACALLKGEVRSPENATTIASCERLIARHVIMPARSAFLGDSRRPDQTSLRVLLQPLHDAISASKADSVALRPALLSLLDITIRSNKTPAYKSSTMDTTWIQGVVAALAYCGGTPVDPESKAPLATIHLELSALEGMLRILKAYKVKLETSFLEWIAKLYCGLDFKDNSLVQWSLVALILDLDADVFVAKGSSASGGASGNLFTLIPDLYLNPTNATETEAPIAVKVQLRDAILNEIVVPLMRAYAKRRNLPDFMSRWLEQLQDIDLGSTSSRSVIWQDRKLLLALRPLLETNLTTTQISRLLTTYTDLVKYQFQQQLQPMSQSGLESSVEQNCHAPLVLLDATLGAIEREETVTELKDQLIDLQATLWHLGEESSSDGSSAPESPLRRLLGRLLDLTLSYLDVETLQQQAREHLSSTYFARTCNSLLRRQYASCAHGAATGNEALRFILHTCGSYAQVDGIKELVADKLNSSIDMLATNTHIFFQDEVLVKVSVGPDDGLRAIDMTWLGVDTLTVATGTLSHPAISS